MPVMSVNRVFVLMELDRTLDNDAWPLLADGRL